MYSTLSVLITYYNERHLLGECLASLFAQQEWPDEVLIYDDASIYPACDYVPKQFPVRIIRGEANHGPAYGRNVLLNASSCDYVHFHDADDLFHTDWLQRVRQAIVTNGTDAVFTEISAYRDHQFYCQEVLGLRKLEVAPDLLRFCLNGIMLVPAGTYRTTAVRHIQGYRPQLWQSEDFDFHVRLAASGIQYTIITDPLVFIRVRPQSRSQNHWETRVSLLQAVEFLANELPSTYHRELAEVAAYVGSGLFKLGDRRSARVAFRLARQLGPPAYIHQRRFYRIVANQLGAEIAENVTALYRSLLPEPLRRMIIRIGW